MVGPGEVQGAADAAVAVLSSVLAPSGVAGSRAEWAGAVGSLQQVIDVATAAQDAAIVRLAAIEPEWCEDGTEVETHKALGHVALDAPAILSGVLVTAAVHAERRVEAAVLLAADGPDGSDTGTGSGLGGLHAAMGQGRLDPYRASVVAEELEAAPVEVRETVVTMLEGHFEVEDGAHLRRRCRRALARISPDLLRQRALKARSGCGLRRWVAEPGVDKWEGTFPSEDAATAWAAIDALAHQYVKDGVCTHIEAARGKALTDLVAGQASIDTVLTITVPATGLTHDPGCGTAAATYVPSVTDAVDGDTRDLVEVIGPAEAATSASDSTAAEGVNEAVSTVFGTAAGTSTGTMAGGGDSDDLVEVTGPAGNQPVFVSRDWVTAMAAPYSRRPSGPRAKAKAASTSTSPPETEPGSGPRSRAVEVAPCHPDTGALIDPANQPAAPGPETAAPAGRTPPALASTLNRIPPGSQRGVPALDPDSETGQGPRPPVPLPRLQRRRRVLRPRPRPALAGRPHRRHQPDLPVPAPPPGQTATRLDSRPRHRRHPHLDRPHRPGPHHRTRRRPDLHRPRRRSNTPTTADRHQHHPHRPARRTPQRPRVPPRTPRRDRPHPLPGRHALARRPRPAAPTGHLVARRQRHPAPRGAHADNRRHPPEPHHHTLPTPRRRDRHAFPDEPPF